MKFFPAVLVSCVVAIGNSLHGQEANLWTGEEVTIGGVFAPHLHTRVVTGISSSNDVSDLANGHHDPQDDFTLQSFDLAVSMRASEHLHGFAAYTFYSDSDADLDGELEEAFIKVLEIPGGFSIRGGRYLNRFGFQSTLHDHAWDFVNQHLVTGRLLQEGALATAGGEVSWALPLPTPAVVSCSIGDAHSHKDHSHEHGESAVESDGAYFTDIFQSANFLLQMDYNDFHRHRATVSAAWGGNEFDRTTTLFGAGYEYLWRENGYEFGGRHFRWRNEVIHRRFGAVSHEDHHHDDAEEHHGDHPAEHHDDHEELRMRLDDTGFYSSALYGWNDHLETGVRVGYVTGVGQAGLEERWRISPVITLAANARRTALVRVQYDFDYRPSGEHDHTLWMQIGFNWGGPEVR